MNRRGFLRSIFEAGVIIALPAPITYILPPRGGWRLAGNVYTFKDIKGALRLPPLPPAPTWARKTPQEILVDINTALNNTAAADEGAWR